MPCVPPCEPYYAEFSLQKLQEISSEFVQFLSYARRQRWSVRRVTASLLKPRPYLHGGGGPVAAEGEELEPPADGGGAAPANEERVHVSSHAITIPFNTEPESPAPAPAQTTSQSTNVRNIDTGDAWTGESADTSQGQRNSG